MMWRLGRKLEPRLSQAMDLVDSQWAPPWVSQTKPRAQGTVFTSNIEVAEYFRLAYGFSRSEWLEERARYEAAKAQQATQGQVAVRYGERKAPSAEEIARVQARNVFSLFCRETTNDLKQAPPNVPDRAASRNR
jgi:hypothetical protein